MIISIKAVLPSSLLLLSWGCGAASSFEGEQDLTTDVGVERAGLRKGTPGARVGDGNYCDNPAAPCAAGEGDCDGSGSCEVGLVCSSGKLKQFGFTAGDACVPAHCANKRLDADETQIDCGGSCGTVCATPVCRPNGTNGRCNSDCLCQAGEGDCDSSAECASGLVCGGKLSQFGFAQGNACIAPHCTNNVRDADETQIDCGGSCGTVCPTPVCQPNGTNGRCNSDCLCQAGEGDCDSSAECAAGLVCGGKLSQFGFAQGNACIAPHCTNKLRDGNETQVDCGGDCGSVGCEHLCMKDGSYQILLYGLYRDYWGRPCPSTYSRYTTTIGVTVQGGVVTVEGNTAASPDGHGLSGTYHVIESTADRYVAYNDLYYNDDPHFECGMALDDNTYTGGAAWGSATFTFDCRTGKASYVADCGSDLAGDGCSPNYAEVLSSTGWPTPSR